MENHPNNPKLNTQVIRTLTVSKTNHNEHLQNQVQSLINSKQQPPPQQEAQTKNDFIYNPTIDQG